MPTHLTLEDHLKSLRHSGDALRAAAANAGLDTKVPTCPGWSVTSLVAHQGMVHRWAAATLRGERDHDTADSQADAAAAPDLLAWYAEGLDGLLDTIASTPEDAEAAVFLNDAPPPRRFWARRQAHETTIHSVDAVSAALGRWPTAAEVSIDAQLAVDGIDELVTGFLTRGPGKLHTDVPCTLLIRTEDTGHAWTVRLSDGPIISTVADTDTPDAVFAGSAAQLYLSLWNRSAEVSVTGRPDLLDLWRAEIRIRW